MPQRDFILREIERLGRILAAVRARLLGGATTREAVRRDLHAAAEAAGVDLELARRVTPETLLLLVGSGPQADPTRCWFLAECFYLEGLEAHLSGDDTAAASLLARARFLYGALASGAVPLVELPETAARLREIDALLEEGGP